MNEQDKKRLKELMPDSPFDHKWQEGDTLLVNYDDQEGYKCSFTLNYLNDNFVFGYKTKYTQEQIEKCLLDYYSRYKNVNWVQFHAEKEIKLEFTPEFLAELEIFELKYNLDREFLLKHIEDALDSGYINDFKRALIDGVYNVAGIRASQILIRISCLDLVLDFTSLHQSDCTNWKEYFSWRLKKYERFIPE